MTVISDTESYKDLCLRGGGRVIGPVGITGLAPGSETKNIQ